MSNQVDSVVTFGVKFNPQNIHTSGHATVHNNGFSPMCTPQCVT